MVLESTKLERLRVIRDATFVDRFERAGGQITFTGAVDEAVAVGEAADGSITFTPAVSESTLDQAISAVIDDFEDADISEYTGDTAGATVQTSTVIEGTYSLTMSAGGNTIFSTTGLPDYPEAGDIFLYNQQLTAGAIARFGFGVQDTSNYYFVELDSSGGQVSLGKVSGGSESTLASASQSIDTGATVEVEVEWRPDGDIIVSYYDSTDTLQATVSANDISYTDGGIAWSEQSV